MINGVDEVRVISGKCRGTKLIAPEGLTTRPTTDRIKETLFNMIAFDIPNSNFLDLFSGSGAIGIESLSRGAKKVVFVEKDKVALDCIEKNLIKTHLKENSQIYPVDVLSALKTLEKNEEKFDIIFMDPPYHLEYISEILQKILDFDLLSKEGYIILERSSNTTIPIVKNLVLWKEKIYKTTTINFLRKDSKK